jgi:hypothetical protein
MADSSADDRDSPWKDALDRYLEAALRLLFPAVHARIDWSRRWQALDGELQQVVRDAELGRRLADKLFRVHLLEGGELWVALHLEVQGQVDEGLPRRVHVYRYRINDRYDRPVASLVVLADDRPDWRPVAFEEDVLGTRLRLEFPTVKLLDLEPRLTELLADPNPFALVVAAHLASLRTRKVPEERLRWKLALTRRLYERGHERKDVLELFRFLDWLLRLPPPLEAVFEQRHAELEQETNMTYKMKFEVEAEARGEAKGQRGAILTVLETRFGSLPSTISQRLETVEDVEQLARLVRELALARSLEQVLRVLDRHQSVPPGS